MVSFSRLTSLTKKQWIFVGGALVLLLLVVYFIFFRSSHTLPAYEFTTVSRGTVRNVVGVVGYAEPVDRLSLGFTFGGRIASIPTTENKSVTQGEALVSLDNTELSLQLEEAQARLRQELATLASVRAPLRPEEIALKQGGVTQAEQALISAETSAKTALSRALVLADSAIHKDADTLFTISGSANPRFGISFTAGSASYTLSTDRDKEVAINTERQAVERMLERIRARVNSVTRTTYTKDLADTEKDLAEIEQFLSLLASVIDGYTSSDVQAQTVYGTLQAAVGSARTAINTARSEISLAQKERSGAETALALSQQDYTLAQAGASQEKVQIAEASVEATQRSVEVMQNKLDNAVLRAPIAGVVGTIYKKRGEVIAPNEPILELVSDGSVQVEAYIPEADIARVRVGNEARVTFDAFTRTDIFSGVISSIALAETIRDGVPTYKTVISIAHVPDGFVVRPGMTADMDITTDVHDNVLFLPARSVLLKDGRQYVRILNESTKLVEERTVTAGLRGSDGTVEITSGLNEGEKIILFIPE